MISIASLLRAKLPARLRYLLSKSNVVVFNKEVLIQCSSSIVFKQIQRRQRSLVSRLSRCGVEFVVLQFNEHKLKLFIEEKLSSQIQLKVLRFSQAVDDRFLFGVFSLAGNVLYQSDEALTALSLPQCFGDDLDQMITGLSVAGEHPDMKYEKSLVFYNGSPAVLLIVQVTEFVQRFSL